MRDAASASSTAPLSEGDDCVGHQLNWNTRLGVIERLDAIGVGEITMPSHVTFSEERDLVKACRRMRHQARRSSPKGPGVRAAVEGRLEAASSTATSISAPR